MLRAGELRKWVIYPDGPHSNKTLRKTVGYGFRKRREWLAYLGRVVEYLHDDYQVTWALGCCW